MDDAFRVKVRAAAAAAWWTLLVAAALLLIQWGIYLLITGWRPQWALAFWGPGATWERVQTIWFDALVWAKVTMWPLLLGAIWLTFWERRLRGR